MKEEITTIEASSYQWDNKTTTAYLLSDGTTVLEWSTGDEVTKVRLTPRAVVATLKAIKDNSDKSGKPIGQV